MGTQTYLATASDLPEGINKTLVTTTADAVTVVSSATACRVVVVNRAASALIYFTYGTGVTAVAAADGTIPLAAGKMFVSPPAKQHVLSIVGSGDAYSVVRLPDGAEFE